MEFVSRFFRPPSDHFFLLGPRGTGKTSLVQTRFPEALRIDLLDPDTLRRLATHPEHLAELVAGHPNVSDVVVDEVQKLPELLEVIHLLIERKEGHRFVLTGSSARKLRQAGVNLLGGRAARRNLHPFMAAELGDRFSLDDALYQGMLPVVLGAKDPEEIVQAYAGLYLKEEVQAEGLVRNLGGFSRFLETISFSQASVLNLASVARDSAVHRKTVDGHLEVLEDLLLAFRLPVFTRRARRKLVAHPKFFLFDAGLFRALRPRGPLDMPSEIDGAALETLVAQHLRAWIEYTEGENQLYYWQTRSKVEVDFVLYGTEGLTAIEVKNSPKVRPGDLRGLREFGIDYPESRRILVYRGTERFVRDEVLCLNCEEFLRELVPGSIPE